eukprot:CAMPEP_0185621100 /NCGR_PEP_ID=MMETSP0436-20130131/56231_1 /TAXON_ID=626734 ORGANISM="Favella taraikaensis, Strain Fe Narragansett Bay" /NCGR_SAMPLE_ID=MMETSP0436 /ASSEMBLY_ACC=CAM_ASM_000390 /LENGTH=38 /DNA_ID= /DNA_START= /DNA_END= /DNA_ORIENTATION=
MADQAAHRFDQIGYDANRVFFQLRDSDPKLHAFLTINL